MVQTLIGFIYEFREIEIWFNLFEHIDSKL